VPEDKAVFGVLVSKSPLPKDHWYEAKEGERFAVINALGEKRVWYPTLTATLKWGTTSPHQQSQATARNRMTMYFIPIPSARPLKPLIGIR